MHGFVGSLLDISRCCSPHIRHASTNGHLCMQPSTLKPPGTRRAVPGRLESYVLAAHAGTHHRSLGAYFTDLPPNMLGSFLMGLFAASGMLGLPHEKELVILPESSSWQVRSALCFSVCPTDHEHCPPESQQCLTRASLCRLRRNCTLVCAQDTVDH